MNDDKPVAPKTAVGIKLFGRTFALRGGAAVAFQSIVLLVLVGLAAYAIVEKPDAVRSASRSPLWISGALWVAMMVYWSAAAYPGGHGRSVR